MEHFGSIAAYGYLWAIARRSNYTDTIANFTVKYIHTRQNNDYSFSWGSGPSVSFSPSSGSQPVTAYVSLRT